MKITNRRYASIPNINDLKQLKSDPGQQIIIRTGLKQRIGIDSIISGKDEFSTYLQTSRLKKDVWILAEKDLNGSVLNALPTFYEDQIMHRRNINLGTFSDYGIFLLQNDNTVRSNINKTERSFVTRWQLQNGHPQFSTHYTNDLGGTPFARRIIDDYILPNFRAFILHVPRINTESTQVLGNLNVLYLPWDIAEKFDQNLIGMLRPGFNITRFFQEHCLQSSYTVTNTPSSDTKTKIYSTLTDHRNVYSILAELRTQIPPCKVLILNYDAHHDRGYTNTPFSTKDINNGNWATAAQQEKLARVVHIPSYYCEDIAVKLGSNWDTTQARTSILQEIEAIGKVDKLLEIWLTIDLDAFSLQMPKRDNIAREIWDKIYHMPIEEVEKDLSSLASFLRSNGLVPHRVMPCSSPDYLSYPNGDTKKSNYIAKVEDIIYRTFRGLTT